jgi:hypothetical protein
MSITDAAAASPGNSTARPRRSLIALVPALVAIIIVIEALAILGTFKLSFTSQYYFEDFQFMLDSGWRMASGQTPGVDFSSPIGPAFYAPYALVYRLIPFSLHGFILADLLIGSIAAAATWLTLRRALPGEAVAVLALLAFLTATSVRELGTGIELASYSFLAPYNRWGWALAIPAVFAVLVPARSSVFWRSLAAGALGAALLLLKVSYFAVFVAVALAAALLDLEGPGRRRRMVERLAGLGLPIATVPLALMLVAPAMMKGYVHDLISVAAANSLDRKFKIIETVPAASLTLGAALFVLWLAGGLQGKRDWRNIARVALAVGASELILLQNHDWTGPPLATAALVFAYGLGFAESDASGPLQALTRRPASFLAALVLIAPPLAADLVTPLAQFVRQFGEPAPLEPLAPTPLRDLRFAWWYSPLGRGLPRVSELPRCHAASCESLRIMLDGMDALHRAGAVRGPILSFSFANPFPALTGTPSPRHSLAWWHFKRTYDERHTPPPSLLLAEPDVVMQQLTEGGDLMMRVYGPALRAGFHPVAENEHWRVWRRNP